MFFGKLACDRGAWEGDEVGAGVVIVDGENARGSAFAQQGRKVAERVGRLGDYEVQLESYDRQTTAVDYFLCVIFEGNPLRNVW